MVSDTLSTRILSCIQSPLLLIQCIILCIQTYNYVVLLQHISTDKQRIE